MPSSPTLGTHQTGKLVLGAGEISRQSNFSLDDGWLGFICSRNQRIQRNIGGGTLREEVSGVEGRGKLEVVSKETPRGLGGLILALLSETAHGRMQ